MVLFVSCEKEIKEEPLLKINKLYRCFYSDFDTIQVPQNFYMKFTTQDDLINIWCDISPEYANVLGKGDQNVHSAHYILEGKTLNVMNDLSTFYGRISNDTLYFDVANYAGGKSYKRHFTLYKGN